MIAPALRVLHLFANYKWTGPADPAIRCAARLRQRGVDVLFAQAAWMHRDGEHRIREELRRRRLPVITGLLLRKHLRPDSLHRDVAALRQRLGRGDHDVLHAHLRSDHLLAVLAARGARRRGRRVVVVRSLYDPAPESGWRERLTFPRTDGVVAPTAVCKDEVVRRFGLPAERVLVQEPPVEPRSVAGRAELRERLGARETDVLVGITARIQPHRRFDLLWQTARRVVDERPATRFVLLGRGNERDVQEQVLDPVRALGLGEHVALPGYLREPDYGKALAALDVFLFLVPGSDGTCRAVREAMARGVPVVASRRGMLPAMLQPPGAAECGLICDEDPAAMATALLRLAGDETLRQRLGAACHARARGAMDPGAAAARLEAFYLELWRRGH